MSSKRCSANEMVPELLAPAGSIDSVYAAFSAGADAVYIGGATFGARAYADNPDEDALCEAIDFAHLQGKRLYLTVNTLIKNKEAEYRLEKFLEPYYIRGLDAVIVQDLGAAALIRKWFPSLELHASTQMSVSGPYAAKMLVGLGFSRIVPARELSLPEIKRIRELTGLEMECFIHGAMCYSYSGLCLMSSMIGGRSGNRGRCAGVCRLPFKIEREGQRLFQGNDVYPLNMKDLYTIDLIPELIEAGVASFKIEGRMKRPEYTAGITEIYRKYIDFYLQGRNQSYEVAPEDKEQLTILFNREGFHQGYYHQKNGASMISMFNEKQKRSDQVQKLYDRLRDKYVEQQSFKLFVDASLKLKPGTSIQLTLTDSDGSVTSFGQEVQQAKKQPLSIERIKEQMLKTGNSIVDLRELSVKIEGDCFLPISAVNELRRNAFAQWVEAKLKPFRRNPRAELQEQQSHLQKQMRPQVISKPWVHVQNMEQLEGILPMADKIAGIGMPIGMLKAYLDQNSESGQKNIVQMQNHDNPVKDAKNDLVFRAILPHIVRESGRLEPLIAELQKDARVVEFVAPNIEAAALLLSHCSPEKIRTDHSIYTFNNAAIHVFEELGIHKFTAPLELNRNELKALENACSELVIYGRAPMMISAQCVENSVDRCTKVNRRLTLIDRKRAGFPVVCICEYCYNVIYNSVPTSLHGEAYSELGMQAYRIELTVETGEEARNILRYFTTVSKRASKTEAVLPGKFTRGHFHRGVE